MKGWHDEHRRFCPGGISPNVSVEFWTATDTFEAILRGRRSALHKSLNTRLTSSLDAKAIWPWITLDKRCRYMLTIHVVREADGWSVRLNLEDRPSVIIEQKREALEVAQRIAARSNEVTILLHDPQKPTPEIVPVKKIKRFASFRRSWKENTWQ
jgi:hypothetical protein